MLRTIISATKAILGAFVLLLAVTNTVSAQDRAENNAVRITDMMKKELTLTDKQYAQVLDINKAYTAKNTARREATNVDKVEKAKAARALSDERDAKLKTVLTEEQFTTYVAKKDEKRKMLRKANFQGADKAIKQSDIKRS